MSVNPGSLAASPVTAMSCDLIEAVRQQSIVLQVPNRMEQAGRNFPPLLVGRDVDRTQAAFAELHRLGKEKASTSLVQSTDFRLRRPINLCKNLLPCLL